MGAVSDILGLPVDRGDIQPGVYPDIPDHVYHSGPGVSNTDLGMIERSPRIYYHRKLDPNRPPQQRKGGQLEGTLAHCAILEPDEFDKRYVVGPRANRGTKVWNQAVDANPERTVIKPDEYDVAMWQARAVRAIPDVAEILSRGAPEQSCYWRDPETTVLCKCRPDFTHEAAGGDILLDLKTYQDADPAEFARQISRKGYHRQAAMYCEGRSRASGRDVLAWIFIPIETEYPYAASAVMLDEESMGAGYRRFRAALNTYAECLRENQWRGHSEQIEIVRLPESEINR